MERVLQTGLPRVEAPVSKLVRHRTDLRYLAPIVFVLPALLIAWVTGFLMLEDRDDRALLALDVTPPGKAGFLAYRVTVTAGVS